MRYLILVSALTFVVSGLLDYELPCDEKFGESWKPSWIENPREDLRCKQDKEECTNKSTVFEYKKYDKCCVCRSCPHWEGNEIELSLEFVSVSGKSLLTYEYDVNETDVFKVYYTNIGLRKIPSNLCNWDTDKSLNIRYSKQFEDIKKVWKQIVVLNLENNNIRTLTDLSCLEKLDEINMKNNKLTHISNTSLTSLKFLRKIYFSDNLIVKIDPGILTDKRLNLFDVDFSNNKLKSVDASNLFTLYPFCAIGFESNEITEVVNEANFKLDTGRTYGPGYVLFNNNKLQTFPNFKELFHLDSITQMGNLFNLGFDFLNIPLICDCHLESFQSHIKKELLTVLKDVLNFKCAGPPELKGKLVLNLTSDQLTCNLPADSGCPTPECNCTDKPSTNLLSINCSRKDDKQLLNSLPDFPQSKYSKFTSVDISGQEITDISNITKLSNIVMLNASNNNLLEINDEVTKALEYATVDFSDNANLRRLPKLFLQYRNVCTTNLKNLLIQCDCESLWIETWLNSKCVNPEEMFNCMLPNGKIKPALTFRSTDIDCISFNYLPIMLSGVTIFLVLISVVIYNFRYEVLIVYTRFKQAGRSKVQSQYNHDVFLSYNDADETVTKWIDETLEDNLVAAGYRVFQAGHDVTFGAERNSEVLDAISKTCNFLLILSDSYLEQDHNEMRPWTENEWKYGWHHFLRDKYKNMIIINFDHMSSFEVNHPQIKAFLRVGCTIDFKNHKRNIMKGICKELGKPFYPDMINVRGLENMKPKLHENMILTAKFQNQSTSEQETNSATASYTCPRLPFTIHLECADNITQKKEQRQTKPLKNQATSHFGSFLDENNFKGMPSKPCFNKVKQMSLSHPNDPGPDDLSFEKIVPYSLGDNAKGTDGVEDENDIYLVNKSMSNIDGWSFFISSSENSRCETDSDRSSLNTFTISIGKSNVSLNSNKSLPDISTA